MKHIEGLENIENLRALVRQDLRELGVKLPKTKKSKRQSFSNAQDASNSAIFGNYLSSVPHVYVEQCGYVPKFLVDASEVIRQNIEQEGLFRVTGAVSRQKQLKQQVDQGKGMKDANVFDVTSLVKQFFRKLPEPLITSMYHDAFIRCNQLGDTDQSTQATLLLCLLLPSEHLSTLRYFLLLLSQITIHADQNKMDAGNLAVVLAPNLMHVNNKSEKMNSSEKKLLQVQTSVVELLICNAASVGMVSKELCEKANLMTDVWGTEDELDASGDALEDSHNVKDKRKWRKRSGSFQGILSTIASSMSKWRRSTDGKSGNLSQASNMSTMSQYSNMSQMSNKHDQSSMVQNTTQQSVDLPASMATPVVIRKRKASGDGHPFSASKKKAILKGLPNQAALANTPYTPASAMKKLDITELKKAGTLNTPSIAFSNRENPDFSATPCANKNPRKRLGLFSPANQRKGRKLSSSSLSINCAGKKSGRSKGLFRRFSGGKGDKPLNESAKPPVPQQSISVGERLGSQTESCLVLNDTSNHDQDKSQTSPIAAILNRSVSSPPTVDQSIISVSGVEQSIMSINEDKNSLNEGFIMPEDLEDDSDSVQGMNVTVFSIENSEDTSTSGDNKVVESSQCVSDTALYLATNNSDSSLGSVKFASGSDISSQSQDTSVIRNRKGRMLRRDRPNSLKAGLLSGDPRKVQKLRRSFGLDKSDIGEPIPVSVPEILGLPLDMLNSESGGSISSQESSNEEMMDVETSKDEVIKESNDVTQNDKENEQVEPKTTESDKVNVNDESTESTENPTFKTCDSTDSLLSGQKSLTGSPEEKSNTMQRSLSTDSGKGSMFDESGVVENNLNADNQEDFTFMDGKLAMELIEKEINPEKPLLETDIDSQAREMRKSISSKELPGQQSRRISVSRSQSICYASMKKQPNFTPDLQISMETHNLLSRAGYISQKSMKKTSSDDIQIMGPPVIPKIKQAEFHKPKRESILALKVNNAGRVKANVQQFENIADSTPKKKVECDVEERHRSPMRFPNSAFRKVGNASPLRVTLTKAKNLSRISESSESGISKPCKGQARLPISTQLLKPTEKVTQQNNTEETDSKKVKRKPSIYYSKDDPRPRRIANTQSNESSFLNSTAEGLEIENANESVFTSMEKENSTSTEKNLSSVITPCKSVADTSIDDLGNKTLTPKMPKILQPLCDTVVLQSPVDATPRSILRRSNTTISPKSPLKAVKRLKSPGSPQMKLGRRHSMSPRRHNISIPMSIPQHVQEEMNGM
ncbi:hypothetical protein FSP39_015445 [Pinctada imbricata]|uniref:Rho-GAP domain-containing protein n=1 Tax=Pinctada imbricata TaxID=66713 RepID=A0AA88Y4Q7_PINIB|nr:hypothetical protein FSP39_015445 [Pinctada imbricata]